MGLHQRPPHQAEFAQLRSCSVESSVKMWVPAHLSVGLPIVILQLLASSHARPQTVHEVGRPADRARVLTESGPSAVPKCDSALRRSLPECQQKATVYGRPGQVWGELTVDVSSPVLFITKPKDLIQKRKNKNKKKEKQDGLLV